MPYITPEEYSQYMRTLVAIESLQSLTDVSESTFPLEVIESAIKKLKSIQDKENRDGV